MNIMIIGKIIRSIFLVPAVIIRIAIALLNTIIMLPFCLIALIGGHDDIFDEIDDMWSGLFKF